MAPGGPAGAVSAGRVPAKRLSLSLSGRETQYLRLCRYPASHGRWPLILAPLMVLPGTTARRLSVAVTPIFINGNSTVKNAGSPPPPCTDSLIHSSHQCRLGASAPFWGWSPRLLPPGSQLVPFWPIHAHSGQLCPPTPSLSPLPIPLL